MDALKSKVRTEHQAKLAATKQERQVGILENRLEVATKRFNALVADNAKLRKEIDDLLVERARFNGLWMRLNGQLSTGKQILNDLIEQATITFNHRDEELNKINALKERCAAGDSPFHFPRLASVRPVTRRARGAVERGGVCARITRRGSRALRFYGTIRLAFCCLEVKSEIVRLIGWGGVRDAFRKTGAARSAIAESILYALVEN